MMNEIQNDFMRLHQSLIDIEQKILDFNLANDATLLDSFEASILLPAQRLHSLFTQSSNSLSSSSTISSPPPPSALLSTHGLQPPDFLRYGRQLILPLVGLPGQQRLARASVLVVGAGGTGSPVLQYLAAMGVGRLCVVDHDHLELSNLHRQIVHGERSLGLPKAASAARALRNVNRQVLCAPVEARLTPANALQLCAPYDLLVDCTDNLPSRYLLSDAAVLQRKPLVSASAIQSYAQLYTFLPPPSPTPCYRCLYPYPPPSNSSSSSSTTSPTSIRTPASCDDAGVLGVVPGIVGCLAALEAVKIILGLPHDQLLAGRMLLMDATDGDRMFKTVRLRAGRSPQCRACSTPYPSDRALDPSDYPPAPQPRVSPCGGAATCPLPAPSSSSAILLPEETVLSPQEYVRFRAEKAAQHVLVDVRSPVQFGICALPGAVNVPLAGLLAHLKAAALEESEQHMVFVCRRGIASKQALSQALTHFPQHQSRFHHIEGGLEAYHHQVDSTFPKY